MELYQEDSLKTGAIAGAVAFVTGLLTTVLLASPSEGDEFFEGSASAGGQSATQTLPWQDGSEYPEAWKVAGWIYHEAHFASIDTAYDVSGGVANQVDTSSSFVMEPSLLVHALPILALGIAGYYVASQQRVDDIEEAASHGAHVVAGYLPLAALSVFVLSWKTSGSSQGFQGSLSAQPELLTGVLFTGMLFPIALGALGGVAAFKNDATSS